MALDFGLLFLLFLFLLCFFAFCTDYLNNENAGKRNKNYKGVFSVMIRIAN